MNDFRLNLQAQPIEEPQRVQCTACREWKPADQWRTCEICRRYYRERSLKWVQRARLEGRCLSNGCKGVPVDGKKTCEKCRQRSHELSLKRYQTRRARGLCGQCGQCEPMPGRTMCQKCKDRSVKACRKQAGRWRRAGRCQRCGTEEPTGRSTCDTCMAKRGVPTDRRRPSKQAWENVDWARPVNELAQEMKVSVTAVYKQRRNRQPRRMVVTTAWPKREE